MLLIVGLGNFGLAYKGTYHNMGFMTVDKLAEKMDVEFKHRFCQAKVAEFYSHSEKIVIAKPQTYMNLSGLAVRDLLAKYNAKPSDLIVVYDDIDLDCGALRIRGNGSAGTHNGMRNIIAEIGSQDFPRIRVGIGKPQGQISLADYVLSKVKGESLEKIENATTKASLALAEYIESRNLMAIASKYNG